MSGKQPDRNRYIGEFFSFDTVFSVFRIENRPGWFQVTAYDGQTPSTVCEFGSGPETEWLGAWKTSRHRTTVIDQARTIASTGRTEQP